MIRNIIFDVGNVLIEFNYSKYMEEKGYDEKQKKVLMEAVFQNPLWLDADRGTVLEAEELLQGFISNAPEHESLIRDVYAELEKTVWEKPYAKEWAEELKKRGFHLYVLSNYGKDLFERTKDKMPFLPYMDGTIFSYECHYLKPEPESYQHLCSTCGLIPGESVFMDDHIENVEAARKLGIHGIHFTSYEEVRKKLDTLIQLYEDEERMSYCCE